MPKSDVVINGWPYPLDALCAYEMFAANWQGPAEYCGNETEEGSEFCSDHQPWEPDWDNKRKEALYDCD